MRIETPRRRRANPIARCRMQGDCEEKFMSFGKYGYFKRVLDVLA